MRLLMLNNEFPPLGGGTGVVNYHLLSELATHRDMWVDLVTSSRSRNTYEMEQFADRITIYKVPVDNHNIHHSSNRELLRYAWRGLRKCRQLMKRHSYDLSLAFAGVPAGAISYALFLVHGLPYLVSLQGPDVPGFEARYSRLYPFLAPILRRIWGNAARVTAISHEHQRLARQTMPDLEIPIIHNGVDTCVFRPPTERRQGTEINILCVGRLIERKGQHHLLQAFAGLRASSAHRLRLTLVGTGDAEASLRRLAADMGVAKAVTFTGFVSRGDMPATYREADIFVLPSQNEAMSIALLEAMASELPVVVTDTGGTRELINGNGMVVAWANVEQLMQTLNHIIDSPDLRENMALASRATAQQYSWRQVAQRYLDLCERIAETES